MKSRYNLDFNMTTDRPKTKIKRSWVTVTDPETKKSEHITIYDASPGDVIAVLKGATGGEKSAPRRKGVP